MDDQEWLNQLQRRIQDIEVQQQADQRYERFLYRLGEVEKALNAVDRRTRSTEWRTREVYGIIYSLMGTGFIVIVGYPLARALGEWVYWLAVGVYAGSMAFWAWRHIIRDPSAAS
jgi:hypothetical protein